MSQSQSYSRNLIILLLFACSTITHVEAQRRQWSDVETDRLALLSIKSNLHVNTTGGGLLTSWNTSVHHCTWEGITCGDGDADRRVTALNLTYLGLSGTLSPAVGNLSFLHYLDVMHNNLGGEIPPQIGLLSRLKLLSISDNSFTGQIPANLSGCRDLHHLCLENNSLQGHIPQEFTSLTQLKTLFIYNNRFTGNINFIGNLTNLTRIDISLNGFAGPIPESLGTRLTGLTFLSFGGNSFTGRIPSSIYNLSRLTSLNFGASSLYGTLPDSIGLTLPLLQHLQIMITHLSGHIPASINNLTHLSILDLSANRLSGRIPLDGRTLPNLSTVYLAFNQYLGGGITATKDLDFIDTLVNCTQLYRITLSINNLGGTLPASVANLSAKSMKRLDFAQNFLSGEIPDGLDRLENLEMLNLEQNAFSGRIPDGIGRMSDLSVVYLSYNYFSGEIPASLGNLSKLTSLDLGNNELRGWVSPSIVNPTGSLQSLSLEQNEFSGRIPDGIGRMSDLSVVDLSYNYFSGEIPASLANLSKLTLLDLGNNELRGRVPPSIVNPAGSLQSLSLEGNQLTGEIPARIFGAKRLSVGLYLSGNRLSGSLPKEVGQLENLGELDVSSNCLSGEIPVSLGKCESLTMLNLSGNEFSGPVPESLESLVGVFELDLSSNRLTGKIPVYLSGFDNLEWLNLSGNEFEGEVPSKGLFRFPDQVSVVGNKNLCGGVPNLYLPKCPWTGGDQSDKERKRRTPLHLVVFTLVSILGVFLVATLVLWFLFRFRRRNKWKSGHSRTSREEQRQRPGELWQVSYNELLKATNGFASENLIGTGSFGSVYKGLLQQEVVVEEEGGGRGSEGAVAVKVLNLEHGGAAKSFMRECEALRNIRHRNLVRIRSACSSIDFQGNDFKALVYDLMPRASLDQWLHSGPILLQRIISGVDDDDDNTITSRLKLLQRISIAIDVACALDYLHNNCEKPIVHCDLKPSNILLDSNMVARVGDFGLARLMPDQIKTQNSITSTSAAGVPGTIGYTPPEYGLAHQISTSGDVYSYGIILLEMMTAKRPTDEIFTTNNTTLSLHDYARAAAVGPNDVLEIVDPSLLEMHKITAADVGSYDRRDVRNRMMLESLVSAVKVGVECSARSPRDRMSIKDAIRELNVAKDKITRSRKV